MDEPGDGGVEGGVAERFGEGLTVKIDEREGGGAMMWCDP